MPFEEIQIEQIRYELTWRIRHEVMYPELPFDVIKLPEDAEGIHFGLYIGAQLSAVVSLFNKGGRYQFRKFATVKAFQGKGYGSMLLNYIIAYVRQEEGNQLWCNARISALKFYEKFGFNQSGEYFSEHGIDFVIMELHLETTADA
jgi:predicted GNAT family N-acyltransferase